jgi:hypothetical protein
MKKKGEVGFPAATRRIAMGAARRSLGSRHGMEERNPRKAETSVSLIVGEDPSKGKGRGRWEMLLALL